ncbi:MAG: hypothetical protein ACC656_13090 [Candidatus Heimdallarchaeota archaeon]
MEHHKHDVTAVYICNNCKATTTPPTHCGRAMETNEVNGDIFFQCWKGEHAPCCGRESTVKYENCCDNPTLELKISQVLT